jgi:hypothetical protein
VISRSANHCKNSPFPYVVSGRHRSGSSCLPLRETCQHVLRGHSFLTHASPPWPVTPTIRESRLLQNRSAVEKLLPAKFAKIRLRQDALQKTFSIFLDIFYPPNFGCFEGNGVFQQPLSISLIDLRAEGLSVILLHQLSCNLLLFSKYDTPSPAPRARMRPPLAICNADGRQNRKSITPDSKTVCQGPDHPLKVNNKRLKALVQKCRGPRGKFENRLLGPTNNSIFRSKVSETCGDLILRFARTFPLTSKDCFPFFLTPQERVSPSRASLGGW